VSEGERRGEKRGREGDRERREETNQILDNHHKLNNFSGTLPKSL
jgi:hypothetical protein